MFEFNLDDVPSATICMLGLVLKSLGQAIVLYKIRNQLFGSDNILRGPVNEQGFCISHRMRRSFFDFDVFNVMKGPLVQAFDSLFHGRFQRPMLKIDICEEVRQLMILQL